MAVRQSISFLCITLGCSAPLLRFGVFENRHLEPEDWRPTAIRRLRQAHRPGTRKVNKIRNLELRATTISRLREAHRLPCESVVNERRAAQKQHQLEYPTLAPRMASDLCHYAIGATSSGMYNAIWLFRFAGIRAQPDPG